MMDSDLSLEFLRVVEQAAIACAHTMGQGDRHKSDQVAVEAMRRDAGQRADRRHDRHRRGRARRGADALHRREGRPRRAAGRGAGRRDCPRSTSPSIRSRGRTCARPARRTRSRCWRRRTAAACCTRPTSTWRSSWSGRARSTPSSLDAPGRRQPARPSRSASTATSRISSSSCSIAPRHEKLIADIRATGARIRLIGDGDLSAGIAAAVVGTRRARGDGDRRRARGRADGGGHALPERRDLRAARRDASRSTRSAAARWASRTSSGSTRSKDLASGETIIFAATGVTDGDADEGRPVLRRRHPHEFGRHAEQPAPDPLHRQHSRRGIHETVRIRF